ncbi:MAG: DUF3828 domain-containing protein [Pyrinomonadaceae bacterium]
MNRLLLCVAFSVLFTAVGFAQKSADLTKPVLPDQLIKNLYDAHNGGKSPFFQIEARALIDQYFVKDLADLIWKDSTESNGEVGMLDFDPLYNAQDTDIKEFKIGKPVFEGETAFVKVTFTNFGESQVITFNLSSETGEWRISDIDYGDFTLLSVFTPEDATDS